MATSVDIAKIKQRKRLAKTGFTRMENFLKTIDPDTADADEVRLRLNKLEDLWKSFEESLTELAIYEEVTNEQLDRELVSYEEKYITLKLHGERIIKERVDQS